ncbi:MAG: hypothetical protein PHX58_11395 [Desulfovibrio sp.]|nr:hypothetical protein [Desulfovibrio sp.]
MKYTAILRSFSPCSHDRNTFFPGMLLALGMAVLILAGARTAQAQEADAPAEHTQTRDICLCREVIARTLCKDPDEVEFIDRYMDTNTYSFTVFYAKKPERFICNVSGTEIRIKGKAWAPILRTITLKRTPEGNCMDLNYSVPECPRPPVRCCEPERAEDVLEQKALDFWSRPIPDLLEDELTDGIATEEPEADAAAGDPNAGDQQPQP